MFSMAGAVLFLPFLPMLPAQILLNNILYDLSEISIPFDAVDAQDTAQAQAMDMGLIQRFMFSIGPLSSVFDFITFAVLLKVFDAQEALFQTGWFVESLCTQVLVIFVIRTRGLPWASRPHPMLVATSLGVVAVALALPFTPLAPLFGFVPLPTGFYLALALMVLAYLALVEWGKRRVLR
jgi:Mg2+-importing ATPase